MALCAGGGLERLGMAGTTGAAAVVDTASAFICNAGMWTLVFCVPIIGCMAGGAVQPEHTFVEGRIGVAAGTGCGQAGKLTGGMTAFAGHGMPTRQREIGPVMIKVHLIPTGRVMADRAVAAVLAAMRVILLVTGKAVGWRAQEYLVEMAGLTGNFKVLAFQFEGGKVVVKLRRGPACLAMAIGTTEAEATLVRLILLVT